MTVTDKSEGKEGRGRRVRERGSARIDPKNTTEEERAG